MTVRSIKQIEVEASRVLRDTGCLRIPVPVELVAHRLGLSVEPAALGQDVSGVLVRDGDGGTIGYNAAHHEVRQRFSIAHEIGHFVLHPREGQLFIDKTYKVYRRDQRSSTGEDRQEIQANRFAAALLMPEELLQREVADIGFDLADEIALESLAQKFKVSRQAMSFRLANLGILDIA